MAVGRSIRRNPRRTPLECSSISMTRRGRRAASSAAYSSSAERTWNSSTICAWLIEPLMRTLCHGARSARPSATTACSACGSDRSRSRTPCAAALRGCARPADRRRRGCARARFAASQPARENRSPPPGVAVPAAAGARHVGFPRRGATGRGAPAGRAVLRGAMRPRRTGLIAVLVRFCANAHRPSSSWRANQTSDAAGDSARPPRTPT